MTSSVGSVAVGHGHRVDVLGRPVPGVLDDPALDGPAPQVLVDRVELLLGHRRSGCPTWPAYSMQSSRRQAPDAGPGPGPRGREPGRGCPPRSGPGRCPCPCSRGPRRRRRDAGPRRPGGGRSPAATAPRRAGTCPRSGRWPRGRARRSPRPSPPGRRPRSASTAPAARARLRMASQSSPLAGPGRRRRPRRPPRHRGSSISHRTATEVSSPPL